MGEDEWVTCDGVSRRPDLAATTPQLHTHTHRCMNEHPHLEGQTHYYVHYSDTKIHPDTHSEGQTETHTHSHTLRGTHRPEKSHTYIIRANSIQ